MNHGSTLTVNIIILHRTPVIDLIGSDDYWGKASYQGQGVVVHAVVCRPLIWDLHVDPAPLTI